ncbi:MAG: asparagine synthase-related protein [Gemmatimonadota bacterium]
MSAICAICRLDGAPVPAAQITALLDALGEYGPEAGSWAPESAETPVALGCRPWRITPEDAWYRPPIRSRDGRLVLVADARVDNRAELASRLGIPPADAREMPDAAFILAAYEAWGRDAPRRLLGDFAFALWDARDRSLFCARDGMGMRVLFCQRSGDRVAVATTAHALALLSPRRPRLNEQKVADFLVLLQTPEATFFEGIERLTPGHTLTASEGAMRVERFWSPEPRSHLGRRSDREYVEGFIDVFGQAVRARLRSTGPMGIMLSGGLDSSSVAAMAAEALGEEDGRLRAFHAAPRPGFDGRVHRGMVADESGDVQAIARLHPNIDLCVRRADGQTPFHDIETSFLRVGGPARNPTNLPWFDSIYATAGAEGVRVLLAGHKGNGTISYDGSRSLRDAARQGQWGYLWREVLARGRASRRGRHAVLRDDVLLPLLPLSLAALADRLRGKPKPSIMACTVSAIRPEFAKAMRVEERTRAARRDHLSMRHLSGLDLRIVILQGSADALDAYSGYRPRFGIETRDPTADLRVVEYCLAIPPSQYFHDGVDRWLVRRAMEGRLPDQVRLRTTYGAQSADWTEWLPVLRPELEAELDRLERNDTARRCLDLAHLRALVDRWPERLGLEHQKDYTLLLMRGVMMGRFVRWFEETYG